MNVVGFLRLTLFTTTHGTIGWFASVVGTVLYEVCEGDTFLPLPPDHGRDTSNAGISLDAITRRLEAIEWFFIEESKKRVLESKRCKVSDETFTTLCVLKDKHCLEVQLLSSRAQFMLQAITLETTNNLLEELGVVNGTDGGGIVIVSGNKPNTFFIRRNGRRS